MTARLGPRPVALVAAGFLVGHLPFIAPSLEDIDSVNFALGLHDFDVARHQPHPPGYPVFIALARAARPVVALVLGAADSVSVDAHALAVWGVLLGALGAFPLYAFFHALDDDRRRAIGATAMTLCTPLVWFDASRPMSNVSGLAAIWLAQALALTAWRNSRLAPVLVHPSTPPEARAAAGTSGSGGVLRLLAAAAFVAGVAAGVRSQTVLSTGPLLGVVLVLVWRVVGLRGTAGVLAAGTAGVLVWLVPLLADAGGLEGYLAAFADQAGEDLAGVDMLATNPTPRRLALALVHTFVYPWGIVPVASVVIGLAVFGALVLVLRERRALVFLAAAAVPYAAFHLVLQETFTTRYALPLVAPVVYLVVRAIDEMARPRFTWLVSLLCAAGLVVAVPPLYTYASQKSPVFRAAARAEAMLARAATPPALAMHYAFARALRGMPLASRALTVAPRADTRAVVEHFRNATAAGRVIVIADPKRTDLARFDPASHIVHDRYRWGFDTAALLGGVRPSEADLVEIANPGWVLGDGWSLTPELAGESTRIARGPSIAPIVGLLRARADAARLVLGGRHLGAEGSEPVEIVVTIGGAEVDRFQVGPGFFLRSHELPAGRLASPDWWVPLTVAAASAAGSTPPTAIEQFDLQPVDRPIVAYGAGWHELEHEPASGRLWRWSSGSSTIRVWGGRGDVALRIEGEAPAEHGAAPSVRLRAGERELARAEGSRAVTWSVVVPAALLERSGGALHIETSPVFVPADHGDSADRRQLGLKVSRIDVRPLER